MYPRTLRWLYILNLGVLATHEIDSAYWHEWELFRLPGGIQLFLLLNLLLLLVFLEGLVELVLERRRGLWFSVGLSAVGVFAFGIHSIFLALGHPEFKLPVSLGILVTTFTLSLIQGWVTLRALSRASGEMGAPARGSSRPA